MTIDDPPPVTATIWSPLRAVEGGHQIGIWSHVFVPGNCAGMMQTGDILARVSCWPVSVMDLVDFEANDNAIWAVWN